MLSRCRKHEHSFLSIDITFRVNGISRRIQGRRRIYEDSIGVVHITTWIIWPIARVSIGMYMRWIRRIGRVRRIIIAVCSIIRIDTSRVAIRTIIRRI
jgi:hypothetical protein